MADAMTSPASGYVDQPVTVFYNRAVRKCETGIFPLNQLIVGDLGPVSSGDSPVTVDTRSFGFIMGSMTVAATFVAFIKIRAG
jgi:hypothetical protein